MMCKTEYLIALALVASTAILTPAISAGQEQVVRNPLYIGTERIALDCPSGNYAKAVEFIGLHAFCEEIALEIESATGISVDRKSPLQREVSTGKLDSLTARLAFSEVDSGRVAIELSLTSARPMKGVSPQVLKEIVDPVAFADADNRKDVISRLMLIF